MKLYQNKMQSSKINHLEIQKELMLIENAENYLKNGL
jgi:hypothetical protein